MSESMSNTGILSFIKLYNHFQYNRHNCRLKGLIILNCLFLAIVLQLCRGLCNTISLLFLHTIVVLIVSIVSIVSIVFSDDLVKVVYYG